MKVLIKLLVSHLGLEKNHITAMPEYVLIVYFSVCNASKSQSKHAGDKVMSAFQDIFGHKLH